MKSVRCQHEDLTNSAALLEKELEELRTAHAVVDQMKLEAEQERDRLQEDNDALRSNNAALETDAEALKENLRSISAERDSFHLDLEQTRSVSVTERDTMSTSLTKYEAENTELIDQLLNLTGQLQEATLRESTQVAHAYAMRAVRESEKYLDTESGNYLGYAWTNLEERLSRTVFPSVRVDASCKESTYRNHPNTRSIKLGYISPDFTGKHPLTFLMQDVFRFHDTSNFEVHLYSLEESDESPEVEKIKASGKWKVFGLGSSKVWCSGMKPTELLQTEWRVSSCFRQTTHRPPDEMDAYNLRRSEKPLTSVVEAALTKVRFLAEV